MPASQLTHAHMQTTKHTESRQAVMDSRDSLVYKAKLAEQAERCVPLSVCLPACLPACMHACSGCHVVLLCSCWLLVLLRAALPYVRPPLRSLSHPLTLHPPLSSLTPPGSFDEMVDHMKAVAQQPQELSVEERNLLSVAYKNVIGSRRASWRVISSIEQKGEQERLPLIREYKAKIEDELLEICNDILSIIETELIPNSTSEEGKVRFVSHRCLSACRLAAYYMDLCLLAHATALALAYRLFPHGWHASSGVLLQDEGRLPPLPRRVPGQR